MTIYQNACLWYPFDVKASGKTLPLDEVVTVEFCIGDVTKLYPSKSGDVVHTGEYFKVRLTQKDTMNIPKTIPVQIRVKYKDGIVVPSPIRYADRKNTVSKVVL
jgi:hypothetical protein